MFLHKLVRVTHQNGFQLRHVQRLLPLHPHLHNCCRLRAAADTFMPCAMTAAKVVYSSDENQHVNMSMKMETRGANGVMTALVMSL